MANMSPKKNPIPEQDPNVRNKNFEEVALGYTVEMAVDEANRCLNCPRPACMSGCPVNVKIPQFIARVREQDFKGAYHKILEDSSLPAICGRVCPQEKQCESKCVRGIKGEPVGIGRLERFVADWNRENADEMPEKIATNGHRVAVIGSGPSGLACASDLAKLGYDVTVYEHFHKAGGVLAYGIPEFRLPKAIVQKEIDKLVAMGVNIVCDATIGKCMSIDELLGKDADHLLGDDKYEAVFIGSGAGLPKFQNIPGLSYCGVFSANEFLTRINLMHAYDERYDTPLMPIHVTAVVGAGNVAMDAARCAKRLGADVTVVYRRGEEEIPARKEEYEHAKEEGINFHLLCNPVEILADDKGWVRGLKCIRMELGEPDEKGRRKPVGTGKFETIEVTSVIGAIGQRVDLGHIAPEAMAFNRNGTVQADGVTYQTAQPDIFAGGDVVTGPKFAIDAIAAGREGAISLHRYVHEGQSLTLARDPREFYELDKKQAVVPIDCFDAPARQTVAHDASKAKTFSNDRITFTEAQVKAEASRCLGCGVSVVDQNKCIGCGLCTTRCEFDAIHLQRDMPEASRMYRTEDKMKAILPHMVKRAAKLTIKDIKGKRAK